MLMIPDFFFNLLIEFSEVFVYTVLSALNCTTAYADATYDTGTSLYSGSALGCPGACRGDTVTVGVDLFTSTCHTTRHFHGD
jgi:hypothetical protein